MPLRVLILAAGKGTRMKSEQPKVIHTILKKPMISYVLDSVSPLRPSRIHMVVGSRSEKIIETVNEGGKGVDFVIQNKQLGTGHAVSCAEKNLKKYRGDILIVNGDCPAITTAELRRFCAKHKKNRAVLSLITSKIEDPHGYGRIIREKGNISYIVEQKDASPSEKKVSEVNSGIYCVRSAFLWEALKKLRTTNKQREYYLPDIVRYAVNKKYKVVTHTVSDFKEILGVNDRTELSNIEIYIKSRIINKLQKAGVSVTDPLSTFIAPDVRIGKDSFIEPGTYIFGDTRLGRSCKIGPNVYIDNCKVGNEVEIKFSSYLNSCRVKNNVSIGPFAHLRPEADIGDNAKIGNFVEVKKSVIGTGSKVPHLSYVGDAIVGRKVNIGAGTITCNYDGVRKHQTIIEDEVFIGSDSMLVAPIKVGKGSITAAGSTITKDVDSDSLAIERSQQKIIRDWSKRKKK